VRISRIYVNQPLASGSSIKLEEKNAHYLRNVLRLKTGSTVALFNGTDDCDYSAILHFEGKSTLAEITASKYFISDSILDSEVILGLSRSDHIDFSIQKCTELGVSRISIFNAIHSQIPLKKAQQEKRLAHWQAIAIKACEQCGRHRIPGITFYPQIKALLQVHDQSARAYLLDFNGPGLADLLAGVRINDNRVCLLTGPEGGLAETEIAMAKDYGFQACRLGPRILRTETAAIASLAILQATCGDIACQ
jgi:16S rRNA (uracil1498-N3)-methyltransferase